MPEDDGSSLPPLREVIARHDLLARKSLGQHFLLDGNLTAKIVRGAGDLTGRTVLEVGPGPGGLTRALLASPAARIVAVERDARCVAALGELAEAYPQRLHVVEGDALEVDEGDLLAPPAVVIANLPYNISTPLLFKWLEHGALFESLTLMFQKEVADRLTATPRQKAYGRLSIMVQWRMAVASLFDIGPRAFTPPPKVTSTVVHLVPFAEPPWPADRATLERLTAAAFGQRRKMLRSSLRALSGDVGALLSAADIDPTARAEELSVEMFCRLARALAQA